MSRQLQLDVAQLTDVGRKRPHNEDNMAHVMPTDEQVMARKGALFIVADGMGGHAAGEVASEIAVETVSIAYYQDESTDIATSLINAIKRANALIHQRAAENMSRSGMGTTCVSAAIHGGMAYIANVGDSRAYIVRNGQVRQISQDHSWVEEQVRAGLLTRDQARSHAQRNVITRCLGTQTDVDVDVFPEALEEGDTLILCSDGLSGAVLEEDLRSIIDQYMPQESVYHLIQRANENGGLDNITAIVVRVRQLGWMPPNALHPVYAGGHEVNEDTAVVECAPSAPLSASGLADVTTARVPSAPLRAASGPLMPASLSNSPVAARAVMSHPIRKRSRLLLPTLALLVLLVVTLLGGGAYYFFRISNTVSARLSQATALIQQTDPNQPVSALQKLSQAQQDLLAIPANMLVGSQARQFSDVQATFTRSAKSAIVQYNQQKKIAMLPCSSSTTPIQLQSTSVPQPVSLVTVQGINHTPTSYMLASDQNLYLLDPQQQLVKTTGLPANTHVQLLTNNSQHLFALSPATAQPGAYTLSMLSIGSGATLQTDDATIGSDQLTLANGAWVPRQLTASETDVFVVLSSKVFPTEALILDYTTGAWQDPPQHETISISPALTSAVAVSGRELFLLTTDGHVKRLFFTADTTNQAPNTQSTAVEIPLPFSQNVAIPLSVDAHSFTWNTPLVVPPTQSTGFINLSGATLLAANSQNGSTSLFIVDNLNRRVLQLLLAADGATSGSSTPASSASPTPVASATATAGPAQTGGGVLTGTGSTPSWQFVRQYSSPGQLVSIRSIGIDSTGSQLSLLSLPTKGSANVLSINVNQASSCTSNS